MCPEFSMVVYFRQSGERLPVTCLADNMRWQGVRRSFFCDPMSGYEKGHLRAATGFALNFASTANFTQTLMHVRHTVAARRQRVFGWR